MLETVASPLITRPTDADIKDEVEVHTTALSDSDDSSSESSADEDPSHQHPNLSLMATHIVSSPYPDFVNQLHLTPLDVHSRLFALALSHFDKTRDDYSTAPYMDAFNWSSVFETLRTLCQQSGIQWQRQEFYVVIFRSKLLAEADRVRLGLLDQKSHEEACASGGLLKYWFGSPNAEKRNLATCMWVTREDAAAGGGGPWHKQARAAAREMYETISFHTHTLVVEDGASSWELKGFSG